MDLRSYYKKVKEAEEQLQGEYLVMVSFATPEGGKDGVKTEVPRRLAAQLIAEGRARIASDDEAILFYEANREALLQHQQDEAARRVQVMVIPSSELRKPKERT